MSYFYKTPLTNNDGREDKKKHRRKFSKKNEELETISRSHRRKHSSHARCMSQTKANYEENHDSGTPSPKSKPKRHKLIDKPCNRDSLIPKLVSTPESGFMEELNERESKLSMYKSIKLEKKLQELRADNLNLQTQLDKREGEFEKVHRHYEEILQRVQLVEQERSSILNEYKKCATENTQFIEDVRLLKILIYRLNVELERYQDKLRLSDQKQDHHSPENVNDNVNSILENKKISEAWGRVNFHALGPLLEAYQENLVEKDELIKKFRQEIDHFSGRCKEIVAENENLHQDIEIYKLKAEEFNSEIKTIDGDAAIIKEENDVLNKEISQLKQKIREVHSIYEKKVESMSQDNNNLHASYVACQAELSNIQGKYEILHDGYEKMKKHSDKTMPVSVHNDAIEECKRLFEELKTQYQTDKKKLLGQLSALEKSNPENEKLIATLTAERDHLKQSTKNLERNLKRSQHKLEAFQSSLYSIQVSKDSFKRQLTQMTAYCEELVTEQEKLLAEKEELTSLLRKREKENENIQYLGNNISQRMGTLKNQLKSVQRGAKEQLETIEKHIKIQEIGVEKMKSDYHRELQRLKQLVKQKEDVIGKLQREKHATENNLELVWKTATSEGKIMKDNLKNTKNNKV